MNPRDPKTWIAVLSARISRERATRSAPVVRLVDRILSEAVDGGASDIHHDEAPRGAEGGDGGVEIVARPLGLGLDGDLHLGAAGRHADALRPQQRIAALQSM